MFNDSTTDRSAANTRVDMTDMQQLEIEVPSSPRYLPRVRDAVERCARNAGLSPEETEDIKVAASEAFANAIQHGSAGSEDSEVDVRIACRPGEVDVEIRDRGPGFDPSKVPPPDPEQERGRGFS